MYFFCSTLARNGHILFLTSILQEVLIEVVIFYLFYIYVILFNSRICFKSLQNVFHCRFNSVSVFLLSFATLSISFCFHTISPFLDMTLETAYLSPTHWQLSSELKVLTIFLFFFSWQDSRDRNKSSSSENRNIYQVYGAKLNKTKKRLHWSSVSSKSFIPF